jgi:hypothetical protein
MAQYGLVIPEVGFSISVGTTTSLSSIFTTSITHELYYVYDTFCTNFDHVPSGVNFSGRARLQGIAWAYGESFSAQTLGPAPDITLTLAIGDYNPTLSAGLLFLTASAVMNTAYASFSRSYSSFDVSISASAHFVTPDLCEGELDAVVFSGSTPLGDGSGPFSLTRGGVCPV